MATLDRLHGHVRAAPGVQKEEATTLTRECGEDATKLNSHGHTIGFCQLHQHPQKALQDSLDIHDDVPSKAWPWLVE
jgi:hypothetical protein